MDQITDEERRRIAELVAEGAPPWRLRQEVNRSRYAIRRAVVALCRPAKREPQRSPLRLSLAEREEISRGLAAGESLRAIARRLGRAPSTVCREVAANGGRAPVSGVCADTGRARGDAPTEAGEAGRCARGSGRWWRRKLELRWSPQQISGWLVEEFPDDPEMRVSHETIYLSLFVQASGALRKELTRYLRTGPGHAAARQGTTVMNGQGQLRGIVNISRTARRGRRPGRARPLGRRPDLRQRHAARSRPWSSARPAS